MCSSTAPIIIIIIVVVVDLLACDARKAERREQIRSAKAQVKRALKTTLSRSGGGTSSTYLPPGTVLCAGAVCAPI